MTEQAAGPIFGVPGGGRVAQGPISARAANLIARTKHSAAGAAGSLARLAERLDTWANPVTGFGTSRDKTTYGEILPSRLLSDEEQSSLFHHDDMAARMVNIVPQEMLREPFVVETGTPELDSCITDWLDGINVREKLADAIRWSRCFGGGACIIGADDGREASQPIKPGRAKDVSYLYDVDKRYLWPVTYYDEAGHPKLGQPKTYITTTHGGYSSNTSEVHESRLILFHGTPTGHRERMMNRGWNLSVLQRAYDVLRQFNTGWSAVENMMTDGSQAVYKMAGLTELQGAEGGEEAIQKRIRAIDFYRSVVRAIIVDADAKEEFLREGTSFEQIPQVLDKFILRLSATVEIPVTILMGQSPAGMNATGESDFRWFYDRIRSLQNTILAPRVRYLVNVWLRTKAGMEAIAKFCKGIIPQTIKVTFVPLWTETPSVQAERELKVAQKDQIYIMNQVFTPDEVAIVRGSKDGFATQVTLSDEGLAARQAAITAAPDVASEEEPDPTEEQVKETATLVLTASDLAAITKVNEGRASVGLPPLPGPDGQLTLPAFKAKYANVIAKSVAAEAGETAPKPAGEAGAPPAFNTDAGPRTFEMHRDIDESGVSGTGVVAEGCMFADGRIAVRWKTATASTTLFDSIDHVLKVHGHQGKTRIVWDDEV